MKVWFPVASLAVVFACVALGVAALPAAAAGSKTYKTTLVSLVRGEDGIEGRIASPKAACLGNRLVRGEMDGRIPLGNVRTDGSGNFSFPFDFGEAPPNYHFGVRLLVTGKSLGGGATCEGLGLTKAVH